MLNSAINLMQYIKKATTPYHAVEAGENLLAAAGFHKLPLRGEAGRWSLLRGQGYYFSPFPTCLFAFTVGEDFKEGQDFHIAAAHTDFPCLHIKSKAELSGGYYRVNTEVYGSPILNTWLDRPLSIAGRISLRSDDVYKPGLRLVDLQRPVLTIPNLAVHMNRDVNKGVELMKQIDLLPLLGDSKGDWEASDYFLRFLAKELDIKKEDILDFDFYVYNAEDGLLVGMEEEFISSPRLDNLTSCHALLKGLIAGRRKNGINLIALYDNEEVGSRSKQGADSAMMSLLMEKIYHSFDLSPDCLKEDILDSFLLSVDVAHAIHPNKTDKYDPVNTIKMNEGVTFKISANQRYTFDTEAVAGLQQLCEKHQIKYKKFVNHADSPGGGTQGPVISSWLPMKTVDIGVPLLAMHSARELMGASDQEELEKLMAAFFSE